MSSPASLALGQCIGARPVLGREVAVEHRGTENILRARFAAGGGGVDRRHRLVALVRGEEDEAKIVLGLEMALFRGAAMQTSAWPRSAGTPRPSLYA
jgi:hypothetical protein